MTSEELVASLRFGALALLCMMVIVITHSLKWRYQWDVFVPEYPLRAAWLGVAIHSLGWAIHQAYWWLWQMARVQEDAHVEAFLASHSEWTLIPYALILVGAAVALAPYLQRHFGRSWPWASAILIASVVGAGYLAARGV